FRHQGGGVGRLVRDRPGLPAVPFVAAAGTTEGTGVPPARPGHHRHVRRLAWCALAALVVVTPPAAGQRPAERRCALELLSADREGSGDRSVIGNESYFAGGNVRLRCRNQPIFLGGDSLESFGGTVMRVITAAY